MSIKLPELILIQFIIYFGIYLLDNYIGIMICLVMSPIFLFVLIISLLAELLDRSTVPKSYYLFMLSGFLIPLVVIVVAIILDPNALKWLEEL